MHYPALVIVLAILGFPTLIIVSSIWRGYVLSILWAWFLVPAFGLPVLSIPSAIGLSLVVSMLTNHRTGREVEEKGRIWTTLSLPFAGPALFLLCGWVVHGVA